MRDLEARGGRVGGEDGQIFVFVAVILFALFLFVAAVINIGQAVNRRIMLQIAADTGAFTGATEMARGMNTIADLNRRIQQAWSQLSAATMGFTLPPCPASDLGVTAYGIARRALAELIRLENIGYALRAGGEARRVTEFNAAHMFPGERLSMGESDPSSGIRRGRPLGRLVQIDQVPSGTAPDVPSLSAGYVLRSWSCWGLPPVQPRTASFSLWYQARRSAVPIHFVWVVKAPPTRARVLDQFFGPSLIPEMTAAAVAKPVGGEIKRGRAEYVAKMIPLNQLVSRVFDPLTRRVRTVYH